MEAKRGRACFVNSCRISHLGMNPDKGGRPPRDSTIRGNKAVRIGALDQEVASEFIVVEPVVRKVMKAEAVIKIYSARDRRVRKGSNLIIITIQPRWAIDE